MRVRRMRIESTLAVVLLAVSLGTAAPLGAQAHGLDRIRDHYGDEVAERVSVLLEDARGQDVPEGPIMDKALEGAAKGVPASRLLPVLESFRERLGHARSALGSGDNVQAIVAGAEAMKHGLRESALGRISRAAGGDATMALVAAGDLARAGAESGSAAELVERAVEAGQSGAALLAVSAAVRRRIERGESPAAAIQAVREALVEGTFPEERGPTWNRGR